MGEWYGKSLLNTITNNRSQVSQMAYDNLERLWSVSFPTTGNNPISFTYFGDGSIATATDTIGGSESFVYLPSGRLSSITYNYPIAVNIAPQTVQYTYWPDGARATMEWLNGSVPVCTWNYGYDLAGRLNSLTNTLGAGESASWQYDGQSELINQWTSNGVHENVTYNQARGWPANITYSNAGMPEVPFARYALTYDGGANLVGNVTHVDEINGSATEDYGYDALYRLTSEVRSDGQNNVVSNTYGMDLAGNRTTENSTTFATYTNTNEIVELLPDIPELTQSMNYDQDGNLIGEQGQQLLYWNELGEMTNQGYQFGGMMVGYDAFGRRIGRMSPTGSLPLRFYVFDGDELIGEIDAPMPSGSGCGSGAASGASCPYGPVPGRTNPPSGRTGILGIAPGTQPIYPTPPPGTPIADQTQPSDPLAAQLGLSGRAAQDDFGSDDSRAPIQPTVNAIYTWGANGLISENLPQVGANGTSFWFQFGPQGETRALTDSTGAIVDTYLYDAYGNTLSTGGNGDYNPFQYGGQVGYYTAAEGLSGLILCGQRWYLPGAGVWLSRDPIGYAGSDNLYAYVDCNPVQSLDPKGTTGNARDHSPKPSLWDRFSNFFHLKDNGEAVEKLGRSVLREIVLSMAPEPNFPDKALRDALSKVFKHYPIKSAKCLNAARDVRTVFKEIAGQDSRIVRITDKFNTPVLLDATGDVVAQDGRGVAEHFAVEVDDRIYDVLTGPNGATWVEYQSLWQADHVLVKAPIK